MAYKHHEDQRVASKKHYNQNKQAYLNRNKRYKKLISRFVNEIKETTPCADCGKFYPYYVMDFDHLEGKSKAGNVSYFNKTGRIGALRKEITKCEVVCSNCHRERTYLRMSKTEV